MRCSWKAAIPIVSLIACLVLPLRGQADARAEEGRGSLPGLRIAVIERGMHRLTYEMLKSAGAPLDGLDPALLALWHREKPVAIELAGTEDGAFGAGDALIFYGESYTGRYMKNNIYRLTWAGGGERMSARDAAPAMRDPMTSNTIQRARVEFNRSYYSAYADLPRDADHLFDNPLYPNSVVPTTVATYTLDLPNLAEGTATLTVVAHGGRDVAERSPDQSLRLRLNGGNLGQTTWDGSVRRVISQTVSSGLLLPYGNKLVLEASLDQLPGIEYYWVSPDWAEIAYPAKARAVSDRLFAEAVVALRTVAQIYLPLVMQNGVAAAVAGAGASGAFDFVAGGFTTGGIRAYEVTNVYQPVRLTGVVELEPPGSRTAVFAAQPATAYALASEAGFLAPASIEYDAGSDLRAANRHADYIAIVHRSLWEAIQPLLDHRAAEGFAVAKVDVQDIYDEFSGGMVDPEAIRAFLSHAYHQWNAGSSPPQYVLLVGDGHYDFKGELRPGIPNLIPPYLLSVDPYIGETAADNRYASVDGNADFLPDVALGRIPARTAAEVTAVVDKILAYEKNAPAGDWQRRAVFVADPQDDSAGNFHALSDQVRALVPPLYATQPIYYKSSAALDTAAEMKTAIRNAYDSGAFYVQWFGHAARASWSKDRVWELNDPPKLAANNVWPLTAHYSCWSGYFINITPSGQYGNSDQTLAEALLLTPKRGSLADFAPSGLHVGAALEGLNKALVKAVFVDRIDRIGKATDAARKAYFDSGAGAVDVIDTQVLLGDPATRLKLP